MIEDLLRLASQYGFPIVMAFLFYFDLRAQVVELRKEVQDLKLHQLTCKNFETQ